MTKDEYREHMRKYSHDTMSSSFVVTKHPDFEALEAGGQGIVPWLLEDMLDPNWHCDACYGYGYEFAPGWQEAFDADRSNWPPKSAGRPCPKCKGKGNVSSWGCMTLLWGIVGREGGPQVEEWMRGKHDVLVGLWRKWGEKRGYLPPTPDDPEPDFATRLGRKIVNAVSGWLGA